MLIDINLLPQKEPKKIGFIIALSSMVFLLILAGAYYFWQANSVKTDINSVTKQIDMTTKVVNKDNSQTGTTTSTNSISQLKSAIDWAKDYPIQTIPVMRHLASLLPERGFIQSFGYTEVGTITLTVQFDSSREAAYFLDTLNKSKWIEDASLNSLTASTESETTGETTTSANATNTNTTTVTTNQGSTATTNSQTNTVGQSTTAQTTNGTQATAGSTTLVDQNGNVYTIVDNSNTNTTANTTTNQATTTTDSNTLPRYTGQFEIKLNKTVVKEEIKKSEENGEGGTGS